MVFVVKLFTLVFVVIFTFLIMTSNSSQPPKSKVQPGISRTRQSRSEVHMTKKEIRRKQDEDLAEKGLRNCHVIERKREGLHGLSRHPRDAKNYLRRRTSASFGNAVKFSKGGAVLRLRKSGITTLPRQSFSVTAWIKPEGGQADGALIVGYVDKCSPHKSKKGWSIGLRTPHSNGKHGARIYFTLQTDRASTETVITAHSGYKPNQWVHVAAVYNTKKMRLYINGAKVGTSQEQSGDIHSRVHATCRGLNIGGSVDDKKQYRGELDGFQLWDKALRHQEIVFNMLAEKHKPQKSLIVMETFDNLNKWQKIQGTLPRLVRSDVSLDRHDVKISRPRCGRSICDDPEVIKSYENNSKLRQWKKLRYRVINVAMDNGSFPTVSQDQINKQHAFLRKAFQPYKITWDLSEDIIRNTTLRSKTILYGCEPKKVGNGMCNPECQHHRTGNDGGDCKITDDCDSTLIGNGVCNEDCNVAINNWDGGDCCNPDVTDVTKNCFDPSSRHRSYMTTDEYKIALNMSSSKHLNIFFATWTAKDLVGLATLPWEKQVHSVLGGTVVQPDLFGVHGRMNNLVHEIGHNLGLWHVHHGVSEMECSDECFETKPSLELGDLCADTRPTTENYNCSDPTETTATCGMTSYSNTPFKNYMSYAGDGCPKQFTKQQTARMHCYIDLRYQAWQKKPRPSAIPVKPQVVSASERDVRIAWVPPIGESYLDGDSTCNSCAEDNVLVQFASRAEAPAAHTDHWTTTEATGPPDAEVCAPSTRAWLPDVFTCNDNCFLDLFFDVSVTPQSISIWVTWNDVSSLNDVIFYAEDDRKLSLGKVPIFCDMPFTADVETKFKVRHVRIVTPSPYVSIDAVQLTSVKGQGDCAECVPVKYKVSRDPPFPNASIRTVNLPTLEDSHVDSGTSYTYTIQATNGIGRLSEKSPPLIYTHGGSFCGDGNVDRHEECDDGNAADGDGCSIHCQVEQHFTCKGKQSLCYKFFGDGFCEDIDRRAGSPDCVETTPSGFKDQWATSAESNPFFATPDCPDSLILGQPKLPLSCGVDFDRKSHWSPCGHSYSDEDFWVKVTFDSPEIAAAVLIYVASDGRDNDGEEAPHVVHVTLIDTFDTERLTFDVNASCKENPMRVNVHQDLTKSFFKTQGVRIKFTSFRFAVSAVVLRSPKFLDPFTLKTCTETQLYNPTVRQCFSYNNCKRAQCDDPPEVVNGRLLCTGNHEGATCSVKCNEGYNLANNTKITCVAGIWSGVEKVVCQPVTCTKPEVPFAAMSCDGTTFRKRCVFTCQGPAVLQGSDNVLLCEADGLWSLPQSFCKIKCSPLSELPEGTELITRSCSRNPMDVGTRCKMHCAKGYYVQGFKTNKAKRRTNFRLSCTDEGAWNGPKCVRIQCPEPDPIFNDLYTCSDTFNEGSICKVRCPESDQMSSATCTETGEWDRAFRPCQDSGKTCPVLSTGGAVSFDCSSTKIGSRCEVSCKSSSSTAVYFSGTSEVSKVSELICAYTGQWYPLPNNISCTDTCGHEFIQDGWCDAMNNRALCDWDGGDCCASTVDGGVVMAFKCSKSEQCSCRDPSAVENQLQDERVQSDQPIAARNKVDLRSYKTMFSKYYEVDKRPEWFFAKSHKSAYVEHVNRKRP